jgi:Nickel/cobalt transporter regulator
MLRPFVIAAMFALVAPTLTMAQQVAPENRGGPPHPGGPPGGGAPHPGGGPPGGVAPHFAPAPHPMGPPPGLPPGPPPGARTFGPPPGGPPSGQHPIGPPEGVANGPHPGGQGQFNYRGRTFTGVHAAPFAYPPGWEYRRWGVGAALPPVFLTPDYFYPEWAGLGLDPPPPGYQWVRYGPDLLLVDVNTGEVAEVVYGVFDD